MLLISEIFQTIQGEGTHTGRPSVFVRLQGCPVGCPWCDTKYTWDSNIAEGANEEDVFTRNEQSGGIMWNENKLIEEIEKSYDARHIVLTGGEPCAQNIFAFCDIALQKFSVQLETSGTFEINVPSGVFVTVSPKIDMPGGRKVLIESINRADEVKYPVGKYKDIEALDALLAKTPKQCNVWLQPLSQSPKSTSVCVDICTQRNWRLSVQSHKYIGLP
jgi:7-carboxy-7-deazaguanine synthase